MRQIVAYGRKVYGLARLLRHVTDGRRKPRASASAVAAAVLYTGLLRIRSFNALEPRLYERPFLRLLGMPEDRAALCSADTLGRSLRAMDVETAREVSISILRRAERNKVFREGWHGALRYVALDGWEPIRSRHRHCPQCLLRQVTVKGRGENKSKVVEYYHRYAVAMLIDKRFDLALDMEPVLPSDLRPPVVRGKRRPRLVKPDEDEGELTAAKRLIKRVKHSYGWVDVVVGDSLYANGPFLTLVERLGLGAVIVARRENDEPLKEALHIWKHQAPHEVVEDELAQERIELWDCRDLEMLRTYEGKIRVVRGQVSSLRDSVEASSTWCMLVTGTAKRLAAFKVLAVARARWHIENTGFHQWTTRWRFDHVFVHDGNGIRALFWLFFAAFNLLTLFLYCQLKSYCRDRGKDVTRTISRLIDQMLDDLARLDQPLWDTS
ncbi:MAG: transposase [Planctomycetota bacterium]